MVNASWPGSSSVHSLETKVKTAMSAGFASTHHNRKTKNNMESAFVAFLVFFLIEVHARKYTNNAYSTINFNEVTRESCNQHPDQEK